ncbi:Dps family protein [Paenibacillus chitinolyticus]|uniref:Dps family protein n=1 Tax=Paenibacillus chitinolyticus TaxID=79263 RepID=UPI0036DCEF34
MKTLTGVKTVTQLNQLAADWTVLSMKLRNFHWFVNGPHFFTLHAKFEEFYNEAAQHIDEIAERVLALKGKPVATLAEALKLARLEEAAGSETAEQMVEAVRGDFERLVGYLQESIAAAEEEGDEPTADMLIGLQASLQKHVWMLGAFLGRA